MKRFLRFLFLFVLFVSTTASVQAQRYLGVATSDWSAINSLYLNPANIADCRENFSIGLFSLSAYVDNNLGLLPSVPDMGTAINNSNNIFTRANTNKFSMLAPAAVFRGPGAVITLSDKTSIALTSGIRAINQFNNFDPALYKMLAQAGTLPITDYKASAKDFNWTAHMWSEIGLTFGAVLLNQNNHRLNFGITVRRLGGFGYLSVTGKNLDLNFKADSNNFAATNSDIAFSSNLVNDSSAEFKHITPGGLFNKFFGEVAGGGFSTDFGFTYRYRIGEPVPSDYQESDVTHDLVLSAAVTDFGAIRYYSPTNSYIHITGDGVLGGKELSNKVNSVDSVTAYARSHGFKVEQETRTRRVYLPVALVVSADVQVYGRFFANLLYIANLANRNNFGNSYYNQLTLTPRYDFHKLTVAVPLTYSVLAHDLKLGIGARYKGIFIGSDDLMALMNKYQYGFGCYFGAYIPVFKVHRDPTGTHWK